MSGYYTYALDMNAVASAQLAQAIFRHRHALKALLRSFGYSFSSEREFIDTVTSALFDNPQFLAAADPIINSYQNGHANYFFIAMAIAAATTATVVAIKKRQKNKIARTSADIRGISEQARIRENYFALLRQAEAEAGQSISAVLDFRQQQTLANIPRIVWISLFAITGIGITFYIVYKIVTL